MKIVALAKSMSLPTLSYSLFANIRFVLWVAHKETPKKMFLGHQQNNFLFSTIFNFFFFTLRFASSARRTVNFTQDAKRHSLMGFRFLNEILFLCWIEENYRVVEKISEANGGKNWELLLMACNADDYVGDFLGHLRD